MTMSSHELARALLKHRDNDVKIEINNIHVPVGTCYYNHFGDQMCIEPDFNSEDYRIAMASTDPMPADE